MGQIIISIHTMKSVSTIQLKYNDDYIALSSKWTGDEEKFPLKALLKGVYQLLKIKFRRTINKKNRS